MTTSPSSVLFDAAQHRYSTADGRELISVTAALTEAGLIDRRWFTEADAMRGTRIHRALALYHERKLSLAPDDDLRPYIQAYQQFEAESGFTRERWEEQVADETIGAAGTLDLRGAFPNPNGKYPAIDLLDIKTGAVPSWVGYQTAGYSRMLPHALTRFRHRWCLQLCPNGNYRLHPLTKSTDEAVFLAALTVAKAKRGWL